MVKRTDFRPSNKNVSYSPKVKKVMEEYKEGKLKTSQGKKVTGRKQAIAIALSEARQSEQSPKELPIYKINGKLYYRDVKLGEYRNIHNPQDTKNINFPNEYLEKPKRNDFSQDKYREDLDRKPEKYDADSKLHAKKFHGYVIGRKLDDDNGITRNYTYYPNDYHGKPPYMFKNKSNAKKYLKKHPDKFLHPENSVVFKYTPKSYLDRY